MMNTCECCANYAAKPKYKTAAEVAGSISYQVACLERENERLKKEAKEAAEKKTMLLCVGGSLHGKCHEHSGAWLKVKPPELDITEVYTLSTTEDREFYLFFRIV